MDLVEIHRAASRASCDERAFVLHAVGIASETAWNGHDWGLWVAAADRAAALAQLERYARENPPRRTPAPPEALHRAAWLGSLAYVAVLLAVGYMAGHVAFGYDWFEAGAHRAGAIRDGEAWRAMTALTLHLDVGHLLANLGFGSVFGLLAGQLLGPGIAWATVLAAAASANFLNAYLQPAGHSSIGASTAVFATLGLLAAYAWRRRAGDGGRWAYRWAPLVAGIILLGFTGAGGEHTDVLAHLSGFALGTIAGVAHATWHSPRGRVAQLVAGALALGAIGVAWAVALAATSR
ncbi:MAG: rhomboid family intramembrane serine protease [Steroidobacteraceae bacterium]|nr:rhomboid family intramembrane serine protease [Steroidobacteraceae bacterium]